MHVVSREVTEVMVACACGKYGGDRGLVACACGKYGGDRGCGGVCVW